tara:strand:- start:28 stop:396 length:369 start_codon:yes stop_codon:yes gene_type:complete
MKKISSLLFTLLLLNGCAESLALLGPTSTAIGGGKVAQSAISSAVSYGIKHQTGKSPTEHALAYVNEYNPEEKKEKCVSFLESTSSEMCSALRKNIVETKEKILRKSKIEDLANKSIQSRRR